MIARAWPWGQIPSGRAIGVGAVVTGLATVPAVFGDVVPPTVAALTYVLGVTIAAAREGFWAGTAASVLSFLGLNFFFTPPRLTFAVEKGDDLVALIVFLAVSAIVGTLLSAARTQRTRAERREREAILLHHVSTRLLSGDDVDAVLQRFADAVADLLGLARCEIRVDDRSLVVDRAVAAGEPELFSMTTAEHEIGQIVVVPIRGRALTADERDVVRTFAGQMAVALERIRFAEAARRAQVEAEESRLRAALFSSVTHDLRTPLASITAAATSLQDEQATFTSHDRRELLDTIAHEADRLNRLVGNLLDLARMRAGALAPSMTPAAIDEVIEGVLDRLRSMLEGRPLRMVVREDLPEISMDVLQIDQVLTNLIENAAKFSPAGSEISVIAGRWHDAVEVRVIDQGPGIGLADRERVFEPFARGDGAPADGTGLGLSIAQAIVIAHGGRMWIDAAPGGGTTVAFTLPVAAS